MKITYKKRLFFWFFLIISAFTAIIIFVERDEERKQKTEALEIILDNYTEIIHKYVEKDSVYNDNQSTGKLDSLLSFFPEQLRVTLIAKDGDVLYDRTLPDVSIFENHLDRPELIKALYQSYGSNVRVSSSMHKEYIYYAKYYNEYFIRVAFPYDSVVMGFLTPDYKFVYISFLLLIAGLIFLNFIAGRFAKSISQLRILTAQIKDGHFVESAFSFPKDELGEIGTQLADILKEKEYHINVINSEREKIIRHFQHSQNGLCIFDSQRNKVYSNTRFMQYLTIITGNLSLNTDVVFTDPIFTKIQSFLNDGKKGNKNNLNVKIEANGKIFDTQVVIFDDKSFEIAIKDITQTERTRLLKQEMTSNIAHELKTPVTTLRGFLETLDTQNITEEKKKQFIHRAFLQSLRLSNLVEDVGLVSKMEEASGLFPLENLYPANVVNDVRIDLIDKLQNNNIRLFLSLNDDSKIKGNYTLLYSIFRNLIDNTIAHAGGDIDIYISNYLEDDEYLYFSYYDTGKGVDEKHLARLFERFYRTDEGRTRNSGGSGLGLSIVKNAIKYHNGEVMVKNKKDAGLEFLFTLHK